MLVIGGDQFIKGNVACTGVVHVGADGRGFGRGAQSACSKPGFVGRGVLDARFLAQAGRFTVHLVDEVFHVVIGLRHGGGTEGIGFKNVSASGQVLLMNFGHDGWLGQHQQFVVALDVAVKISETLAPVLGFREFVLLNHGAGCTVQNQDAFLKEFTELGFDCGAVDNKAVVLGRRRSGARVHRGASI